MAAFQACSRSLNAAKAEAVELSGDEMLAASA
jgi:hypothetical protein